MVRDNTRTELHRAADLLAILNWMWLVIGVIQVVSCVAALAGIWNLWVVRQRWDMPRQIRRRSPAVVMMYTDDLPWFAAFFLINLLLGGVVGVLLIGVEFLFVRRYVLRHRAVLPEGAAGP